MKSIRSFLVRRLLVFVSLILTVELIAHGILERRLVLKMFDASLTEKARTLATLVTSTGGHPRLDFADEFMTEYSGPKPTRWFEIWNAAGDVVERSISLDRSQLPHQVGDVDHPALFDFEIEPGLPLRCVGIRFPLRIGADETASDSTVDIVVAAHREGLHLLIVGGMLEVALVGVIGLAGIAWIILATLRRGVGVLGSVGERVERIATQSLDERLALDAAPIELHAILRALNDSLDRIAAAAEREHRVNAAIAHELRTPLAELQNLTEVALRWPDAATSERVLREAHSIALQMGRLANALLQLSRLESSVVHEVQSSVSLSELLQSHLRQVRVARPDDAARLGVAIEATALLEIDAAVPLLLFQNLIDNALDHGDANGTVEVALVEGDPIRFAVVNAAGRLTPEQVARFGEPLWRGDHARSDPRHAGLGLSIVRAACRSIGAALRYRLLDGQLHAEVEFPRRSRPAHLVSDDDSSRSASARSRTLQ